MRIVVSRPSDDNAASDVDLRGGERLYPDLPLVRSRKQIRVLQLLPGRWDSRLIGNLETVYLDQDPVYEALSYTWGAKGPEAITVNGGVQLPLTRNLFNALRRLRSRRKACVLWIDALCINQSNVSERGHQVSFMGEIYKSAWRVCIWLGNVDSRQCRHKAVCDSCVSKMYTVASMLKYWCLLRDHLSLVLFLPGLISIPLAEPCIDVLNQVLRAIDQVWCTRVWIFQEFHNAKEVLWCFAGCQTPARPRLLYGYLSRKIRSDSDKLSQLIETIQRIERLVITSRPIQRRSKPRRPLRLFDCVWMTEGMESTEPHDRVYSLLGVLRLQEAKYLVPDYNKPVRIICGRNLRSSETRGTRLSYTNASRTKRSINPWVTHVGRRLQKCSKNRETYHTWTTQ